MKKSQSPSDAKEKREQSDTNDGRKNSLQHGQQDPQQVAAADFVLNDRTSSVGKSANDDAVPRSPQAKDDDKAKPKGNDDDMKKAAYISSSKFPDALLAQDTQQVAAADIVLNDGGGKVPFADKHQPREPIVEIASEEDSEEEGATSVAIAQHKVELASEDQDDDRAVLAEKRRVFSRRNVATSKRSLASNESSTLTEKQIISRRSSSRLLNNRNLSPTSSLSFQESNQKTNKQRSVQRSPRRIYGVSSKSGVGKKSSAIKLVRANHELAKQDYNRNATHTINHEGPNDEGPTEGTGDDGDADVSTLEDGLLAVPPTSLSRGTRRARELRPGAYDVRASSGAVPQRASAATVDESEEYAMHNQPDSSTSESEESGGMVRANLVDTDYVPAAEVVTDDEKPPEGRRRRLIINSTICSVVGLIGIAIGLAVGLNGSGDNPTSQPTSATPSVSPSQQPSPIVNIVREQILSLSPWEISFDEPHSGQRLASQWASSDERTLGTASGDLFMQRFVLAVLHFATNGATWGSSVPGFDFISELDECRAGRQSWAPTLECDSEGYVTSINLTSTIGLEGTLPPELALLPRLTSFLASDNLWYGTIPTQIGLMTSLKQFELAHVEIDEEGNNLSPKKALTGTLPIQVANLVVLQSLDFSGHRLEPPMPEGLWQLTQLENLAFGVNTSSVFGFPSEIGLLTSLTSVNFGCCSQGYLATEIGLLRELRELELVNHQFLGFLPSEVGQMTKLSSILLSQLGIRGRVPSEIGNLVSLEKLELDTVTMSGQLPSTIGSLALLTYLSMVDTAISGELPTEVSLLTTLQGLRLQGTNLESPLIPELALLAPNLLSLVVGSGESKTRRILMPTEIGLLTQLTTLVVMDTLTGMIPSELGQMDALRVMDLQRNGLQGRIPSELFSLPNLWFLDLSKNLFRTSIPSEVGRFGTFNSFPESRLDLSESLLQGPIPIELGSSPVTHLDLSKNNFALPFPTELGQLNEIQELRLVDMSLTSIPSFVSGLSTLVDLSLDANPFIGTFPDGWGAMTSLTSLSIRTYSAFVGEDGVQSVLPSDLGLLTNIQFLDLAGNAVHGGIPVEYGQLTRLQVLKLEDTALTELAPEDVMANWSALRELSIYNTQIFEGNIVCENHAPGFVAIVGCHTTLGCDCCVPWASAC